MAISDEIPIGFDDYYGNSSIIRTPSPGIISIILRDMLEYPGNTDGYRPLEIDNNATKFH